MRFAVHQPNFCPWIGFFLKLHASDVFVILDDVQMPLGRSYVSRTKIRGGTEGTWLSLSTAGPSGVQISQVKLAPLSQGYQTRNLNLLRDRYRAFQHFPMVFPIIEQAYGEGCERLMDLNMSLMRRFMSLIGVSTPIVMASSLGVTSSADERIAEIGVKLRAHTYLSGVGGYSYQQEDTYRRVGLELKVIDVPGHTAGLDNVGFSVIDHLMTSGPDAIRSCMYAHKTSLDL